MKVRPWKKMLPQGKLSEFSLVILVVLGDLEEAHRLAHGCLDVERLDVLPVLLQEGHEEIDA